MDDFKRTCFFCSEMIVEKKTLEHIIPNSLLGRLGLKEETLSGDRVSQYSRIKVPAHASCNNGFGSEYEDRVLSYFEDEDALYETIKGEEGSIPLMYGADDSVTSIITTWLSKIYYGLFYDDYIKTEDDNWRETCSSIINCSNMDMVRQSYQLGHGFQLPSSLFVFKTNNVDFDLITNVSPSMILLKIKSITLILCIADGCLTENYLNFEMLDYLRGKVKIEDDNNIDFPSHKLAFAEIAALRSSIPKQPSFVIGNNQIVNMSLSTMAQNPNEAYQIDEDLFREVRKFHLDFHGIQMPD